MKIRLVRAAAGDAGCIWKMQREAFAGLLEKYRDYGTNPASEPLERVQQRLALNSTHYYFIQAEGIRVGAIRIALPEDPAAGKRISPIFILPEYCGRGYAQMAIREAERIYGDSGWELETILQEKANCHLYEKMGYRPTGETRKINERLTLVFYKK